MLNVVKLYIAVRLLLALVYPDLWKVLDAFVELSTPISSFTRLSEGLYLYEKLAVPPYSGGPCHVSPLLLAAFSFLPKHFSFFVFIAMDTLAATALAWAANNRLKTSFGPEIIAAVYLFNPFSLLGSLAQSTNVITNALISGSIYLASSSTLGFLDMTLLALATSLSWYPLYLAPALMILANSDNNCRKRSYEAMSLFFVASFVICLLLAYIPSQSWEYLDSQFGTILLLKDLTRPNIGLWWYFFIEQFEFFRPFFLGGFQMVVISFIAPLTLRFSNQPLFIICSITGICAILKPYPEASDFGFYLTLLVLNRPVFDLLEFRPLEALVISYISTLAPTFYYLWTYVGSGNANFFYAITLVYASMMVLLQADSIWAAIRIGFDGGKDKHLVQL